MAELGRRALLRVLSGAAATGAGLLAFLGPARRDRIRPPGALAEEDFLAHCIRCFRCGEVCPTQTIRFSVSLDLRRSDTPYLELAQRACTLCMRCTEACPTGALTPIPLDPARIQREVRMGTPVLDKDACLPWSQSGTCRLCYYVCPYPDSAVTVAGPALAPTFHADACVGCGLCEEACPREAHAIRIVPDEARRA